MGIIITAKQAKNIIMTPLMKQDPHCHAATG